MRIGQQIHFFTNKAVNIGSGLTKNGVEIFSLGWVNGSVEFRKTQLLNTLNLRWWHQESLYMFFNRWFGWDWDCDLVENLGPLFHFFLQPKCPCSPSTYLWRTRTSSPCWTSQLRWRWRPLHQLPLRATLQSEVSGFRVFQQVGHVQRLKTLWSMPCWW